MRTGCFLSFFLVLFLRLVSLTAFLFFFLMIRTGGGKHQLFHSHANWERMLIFFFSWVNPCRSPHVGLLVCMRAFNKVPRVQRDCLMGSSANTIYIPDRPTRVLGYSPPPHTGRFASSMRHLPNVGAPCPGSPTSANSFQLDVASTLSCDAASCDSQLMI